MRSGVFDLFPNGSHSASVSFSLDGGSPELFLFIVIVSLAWTISTVTRLSYIIGCRNSSVSLLECHMRVFRH